MTLASFPKGGIAAVIGASGGIGRALAETLDRESAFTRVVRLARSSEPPLDLTREDTIAAAASHLQALGELRLVINAAGVLHGDGMTPEKSLSRIDPANLARSFAVNATGPALLMKHLLPLLAKSGKASFATLSARVGSISDNRLGGWYAYRASKAALNQLVRTAAIELGRRRPDAVCVGFHPGTVATGLSSPFAKDGLDVIEPAAAAQSLLAAIDRLGSDSTGGFYDRHGRPIPW